MSSSYIFSPIDPQSGPADAEGPIFLAPMSGQKGAILQAESGGKTKHEAVKFFHAGFHVLGQIALGAAIIEQIFVVDNPFFFES